MPDSVETLCTQLIRKHLCRSISESQMENQLVRQLRSVDQLKRRAPSETGTARYLTTYDMLMRHVELFLIRNHLEFADMPHAALKHVLSYFGITGRNYTINELVSFRHSGKKDNAVVPDRALQDLTDVIDATLARLNDSTK